MKISFWAPLKKKLNSSEKLQVLANELGFDPDLGTRPWQTFGDIFRLRPLLVHAQTETLEFEREIPQDEEAVELPLAKWESYISIEQCKRFLDDTKSMIKELARQAGIPSDEVFAKDSVDASMITIHEIEPERDEPA
jgi:hypothetical protein